MQDKEKIKEEIHRNARMVAFNQVSKVFDGKELEEHQSGCIFLKAFEETHRELMLGYAVRLGDPYGPDKDCDAAAYQIVLSAFLCAHSFGSGPDDFCDYSVGASNLAGLIRAVRAMDAMNIAREQFCPHGVLVRMDDVCEDDFDAVASIAKSMSDFDAEE